MIVTERDASRQLRGAGFHLFGSNDFIDFQRTAGLAAIERLRKCVGRYGAEHFLKRVSLSVEIVVLLKHKGLPLPAGGVLKIDAPTRICAVAPDRVIPLRGRIPPQDP